MHSPNNAQKSHLQAQLTDLRQHLMKLLTPTKSMSKAKAGTLTKVVERLSSAGQLNLQARQKNPLLDVLAAKHMHQSMLPQGCQKLVNSCLNIANYLP